MRTELGRVEVITYVQIHEDDEGELTADGGAKPEIEVVIDYPFTAYQNRLAAHQALKAAVKSTE